MLYILNPDLIEIDLLIMYAHGKLDLRFSTFSLGNAEIESRNICGVEGTRLN